MKYFIIFLITLFFSGCIVNSNPHQVFKDENYHNIGKKWNPQPILLNPPKKGNISRNGMIKFGNGITHITKGKNSNKIYHISKYECLKNPSFLFFEEKGIKGKCLIYYEVNPETNIIINWGFDDDSNPKCCRVTG